MDIQEVTLANGDKVYLKKRRLLCYGLITPAQKDITKPLGKGNINWANLIYGGNIYKFLLSISWVLFICLMAWAYKHDVGAYQVVYEHTCCYCEPFLQQIKATTAQCLDFGITQNWGNYTLPQGFALPKFV